MTVLKVSGGRRGQLNQLCEWGGVCVCGVVLLVPFRSGISILPVVSSCYTLCPPCRDPLSPGKENGSVW